MKPEEIVDEIQNINSQLEKLRHQTGGMLSSTNFRKLLITEDIPTYKEMFRKREWDKLKDAELSRSFIIDPFDPMKLTPFSYDLSIGDQAYSCKMERVGAFPLSEKRNEAYDVEPGETVIVRTEEYIALPRCFSATLWPRFDFVREGMFQSMVKVDPTWYGTLGVALTNSSPASYPIWRGCPFATLILYALTEETDMCLWMPGTELPEPAVITIPDDVVAEVDKERIRSLGLRGKCKIEANNLRILVALTREEFGLLRGASSNEEWQSRINNAVKWKDMQALGLPTLDLLLQKEPRGKRLTIADMRSDQNGFEQLEGNLEKAALEYGGPFKWIPSIPGYTLKLVEKHITPRIQADVSSTLFPRLVTLTLSVFGMLSLVAAVITLVIREHTRPSPISGIDWPGTIAWVAVALGVVTCFALFFLMRPWLLVKIPRFRREMKRDRSRINRLEEKLKEMDQELVALKSTVVETHSGDEVHD